MSLMSVRTIPLGGGVINEMSYLHSWRKLDVVQILFLKIVYDDMAAEVLSGSLIMVRCIPLEMKVNSD